MPNWPFFLSLVKPRPVPLIAATCALRKELVFYMCFEAAVAQKKQFCLFLRRPPPVCPHQAFLL